MLGELLRTSGTPVEPGDPVLRLEDPELEWEIEAAEAQLEQALVEQREARTEQGASLEAFDRRVDALQQALEHLRTREEALVVRSPTAGRWVSPQIEERLGLWVARGSSVGHIVQEDFRFSAVVPQQQAADIFSDHTGKIEVKVSGQAGHSLPVSGQLVIPAQQEVLPSAALGWLSGGEVATSRQDQTGRRAAEPFFEVRADIPASEEVHLVHGCSGRIRFTLEPQPLLRQWFLKLRQLIQKRYQI